MFEKEELKPIDPSKYKITETGQVLKMTKEELEKEKCEILGIIQGKDKVIQELEKENAELKEQKTSKGFYVYNPAGSKPSHIHETLKEAKAEAERIFKLNLNAGIQEPIEVLEIVTKCVPEIKIKWS